MKKSFLILIPLFFSCARNPIEKELETLDKEIEKIPEYTIQFNARCDSLRHELEMSGSDTAAFRTALQLYDAYSPNNVDSTKKYAHMLELLADDDLSSQTIAAACHALCEIKYADYEAAQAYLASYSADGVSRLAMKYFYRARNWLNSLVKMNEPDRWVPALEYWQKDSTSAEALLIMGNYLVECKDYDNALDKFNQAIETGRTNYYTATGNMFKSNVYRRKGDVKQRKHFLIKSAIADIHNNAKEYESLFTLARVLNREKDHKHALKYIQLTVEDAVAANYTSRTSAAVHASKIYNESFMETQVQKHRILTFSIIVLALLLFALFVLTLTIRSSNLKLSQNRQALRERTIIQDKFLGEYMEMSARYIDEVDRSRSHLRKVLKEDGVEQLSKLLRAPSFANSEIKQYYAKFDAMFLTVFPDFKRSVAELLGDECSADEEENSTDRMSVELRILALIRLGITDQKRICNVLHISSWTAYSYLYRMRKAAGLQPKEFISTIQSLCHV